ncbi:flagellin N-terminal helical domain-containing protein [Roseimaritima sediminicola]|uniref:flagellin N-terminal helical domain-containing protein n=1 Tax=Roseimaritima sediminicola TaxID=2662066 RepID=UPI001F40C4FF|nr:flagellin [Roseimaritima sediminicola]
MTRINTNVPSLIAQNRLQQSNNSLQESLTRLSTGLRINSGADDPAGLIASEALRSEIGGLNKAISNTKRASQIISTADSALGQVSSLLGDIRGLVVEAANSGALSDDEIAANQLQIDSSLEALNRIAQTTTFQGRKLLDGSLDFVSTVNQVSSVNDAQIDQANLGATGEVTVNVNITSAARQAKVTAGSAAFEAPSTATADIELTNQTADVGGSPATATAANFTLTNQSGAVGAANATAAEATVTFTTQNATAETDIAITADSSIASGTTITFQDSATDSNGDALAVGAAEAVYDSGTNTITVRGNGDTVTRGDVATAIDGLANFSATAGTAATTVAFNSSTPADVNMADVTSSLTLTADNAGAAYDGATINFVTGSSNDAAYDADTNTLTVTVDNNGSQSLADLKTVIDANTDFTATVNTGGDLNIDSTALSATTTNGVDALAGTVEITADSGITAGTTVTFINSTTKQDTTALAAGEAEAYYNSGTNTLEIRGNGDSVTRDKVAAAISAVDGFSATANSAAKAMRFASAKPLDATLASTTPDFTISADATGSALEGTTVAFASGASNAAAYDANSNTLTITVDNTAPQTLADIKAVVDATDFNMEINTDGVLNIDNTVIANGTTVGGADAGTPGVSVSADSSIAAGTQINFVNSTVDSNGDALAVGAADASYDEATNTLTVRGNGDGVTRQKVAEAISNLDGFTGSADSPAAAVEFATATPTSSTLTASTPALSIAADSNDPKYANATVTFVSGDANAAAYDEDSNTLTVTVNSGAPQSLDDLKAVIDATDFTATVNTAGELNIANTTVADATATVSDTGGLSDDLVFELTGTNGAETFNFKAGATIDDVASAINLVNDATGVTASNVDGNLEFSTSAYGSDAKVAIDVISEGAGGNFTASLDTRRDVGADIVAQVNGTQANGKGNSLSINTATLDLSLSVNDGSDESFSFSITGGGALFQLGSEVVTNQQARMGISSVSTGKLGGASGRLYELGSGQAKSLVNDAAGAAEIVDEVITKVTSIRGRLGAFQATTLESNLVSLNDTVANLQEAESSIRDADFAAESAKLTRAQILVQSGTNVLALANQNPQNVLSLIR